MTTPRDDESAALTVTGIAAGIAGLGTLTLALFPLAIPILALTAVAIAPLAILSIVPVLVVGLLAIPWLVIRRIRRKAPQSYAGASKEARKWPSVSSTPT